MDANTRARSTPSCISRCEPTPIETCIAEGLPLVTWVGPQNGTHERHRMEGHWIKTDPKCAHIHEEMVQQAIDLILQDSFGINPATNN